jgi:hypothetical protein
MHSQNYFGHVQAKRIKYSECVPVALGTQHAKRKCRIALSSVVRLAAQYFTTLPHIWHDFANSY